MVTRTALAPPSRAHSQGPGREGSGQHSECQEDHMKRQVEVRSAREGLGSYLREMGALEGWDKVGHRTQVLTGTSGWP